MPRHLLLAGALCSACGKSAVMVDQGTSNSGTLDAGSRRSLKSDINGYGFADFHQRLIHRGRS